MKKLLDIPREGGYPLCAETLELLHDNVQLLETVLNGLKLPQHTIVRFPYGDYAYVQSCNPASGNGEILKITSGANLANSAVRGYSIEWSYQDIVNANDELFDNVLQHRVLKLDQIGNPNMPVKVYDFDKIFQFGFFEEKGIFRILDENDALVNSLDAEITPQAKYNDEEIRLRAVYRSTNLSISNGSELRLILYGTPNNISNRIIPVLVSFNSNDNIINQSVNASICGYDQNHFQLKIFTHELNGITSSFSGKITIGTVVAL